MRLKIKQKKEFVFKSLFIVFCPAGLNGVVPYKVVNNSLIKFKVLNKCFQLFKTLSLSIDTAVYFRLQP